MAGRKQKSPQPAAPQGYYSSPVNGVEEAMFWVIVMTWGFYFIGALYIVGPVLTWLCLLQACKALYLGPAQNPNLRAKGPIPLTVWVWVGGMLVMLVVLWIGHINNDLGLAKTIKSSVGWAKGWAMLAVLQIVGAVLPIRREVLIRGQCVLGLQTLILLPLFVAAPMIGLPEKLFVSPLKVVGGPGPEYFAVYFYTIDPSNGAARWQFYAPWSPFAGLLGVIMFLCGLEEKNFFLKCCGTLAGLAIVVMTQSRMSLLGVIVCGGASWFLPFLLRAWAWYIGAAVSTLMVVVGTFVLQSIDDAIYAFKTARANSTRVRKTLQEIAFERWGSEAPWFGHGTVQPGAHVTEYMPIGSHHTWFGLLFVKGAMGLVALAVPMVWSIVETFLFALRSERGRLPFGLLLAILFFSFGENMEVQVYLFWPALIIIGIGAQEVAEEGRRVRAEKERAKAGMGSTGGSTGGSTRG